MKLSEADLVHIDSMAIQNATNLSIESKFNQDDSKLRAYAYAEAVVSCLRSKGMLELEVEVEKGIL